MQQIEPLILCQIYSPKTIVLGSETQTFYVVMFFDLQDWVLDDFPFIVPLLQIGEIKKFKHVTSSSWFDRSQLGKLINT